MIRNTLNHSCQVVKIKFAFPTPKSNTNMEFYDIFIYLKQGSHVNPLFSGQQYRSKWTYDTVVRTSWMETLLVILLVLFHIEGRTQVTTQNKNIISLDEHCGLIEGDILFIFIKICDVCHVVFIVTMSQRIYRSFYFYEIFATY